MEDMLRDLIVKISSLTPPYNPVDVHDIFSQTEALALEPAPSSWDEYIHELKTLQALSSSAFEIAMQSQSHTLHLAKLRQALLDDEHQIGHLSQSCHDAFEALLPLINSTVPPKCSTPQIFTSSLDFQTKKALVNDYLSYLLSQPVALNPFSAQLKIHTLSTKVNQLINELNSLGTIFTPTSGQDRFVPLLLGAKERVASLIDMISHLSQFKNQVEHKPPNIDFLNKIQSMNRQQVQNHETLETLETEIATHQLEYRIKNRLNDEFSHASSKTHLIDTYQQKIFNFTCVNPVALYSRFQNDQFNMQQTEYKDCVSYLELLNQKYRLQQAEQVLVMQKSILSELITSPCDLNPNDTLNQLLKRVQPFLLSRFPRGTELSHTIIADCYLMTLEKIPELERQLLRANQSLMKLDALVVTDSELHLVRNQFNTFSVKDIQLLDEQVLKQKAAEYPLQEEELLTKSRVRLCENYLKQMEEYDKLLEKQRVACTQSIDQEVLASIENPLADVLTQIDSCISRLKTLTLPQNDLIHAQAPACAAPEEMALENSSGTISQEIHDLGAGSSEEKTDGIEASDTIALPCYDGAFARPIIPYESALDVDYQEFQRQLLIDVEADDLTTQCPLALPQSLTTEAILHAWHHFNCMLLQTRPKELGLWYHDVYRALIAHLQQEPQSHRAMHVIQDILFELQNNKESDVLYAYKRLCPNPADDIHALLALKPNLPVSTHVYGMPPESAELAQELKPLYNQYIALQKHHSRQAALILDIIYTLNEAKRLMEACGPRLTQEEFPSFSHDPRYESLKRHRGNLKILEMIEDLVRLIIGVLRDEPEHNYLKRPCFFKTQSVRLVDDAFQHLAPPQHAPQ